MPTHSFGKEDIIFTAKSIAEDTRMDSRTNNKERKTLYFQQEIAQSDGSMRVKRGASELDVSVQFKETADTLKSLGLADEKTKLNAQHIESQHFVLPHVVEQILTESLGKHKIGMRTCLNIINDDGNIHDLFFSAINPILNSIGIPQVQSLNTTLQQSIQIPQPTSFAVIGGSLVRDPTKVEECSSTGSIHIFTTNRSIACTSTGVLKLHHSQIEKILLHASEQHINTIK